MLVVAVIGWFGAACGGEKMPDLVKKPYAEAVGSLDTTHFVITRVDTLADTLEYGRGVVISQSIPAGTKLKGESNALTLVVQENFAVVPAVLGQDPVNAAQQVGAAGLELDQVRAEYTPVHVPDEGKVVASEPPQGTVVKSGTKVAFTVRTFRRPCIGLRCLAVLDTTLIRQAWLRARRVP